MDKNVVLRGKKAFLLKNGALTSDFMRFYVCSQ